MTTFLIILFCFIGFLITQANTSKKKPIFNPKDVKESLILGKTESVNISSIMLKDISHFQYVVKIKQRNYKIITIKDFSDVIIEGVEIQYVEMKNGAKYIRLQNKPDIFFLIQSSYPAED